MPKRHSRDVVMDTTCHMCRKDAECRHFELYTRGSEGTWLCHDCEMLVVEFIREKSREFFNAWFKAKEERKN